MSGVMIPPAVSIPRESGATSASTLVDIQWKSFEGIWKLTQEKDFIGALGRSVSREDSSLDGGTVGNSLIWVDGLVWLLSVEVVGDELLDAWNTGRTSDENDLVDLGLVDLGIGQDTVNWGEGGAEKILAQLLEAGTSDGGVEVDTLKERVDLDGSLGGGRKGALGTLASSAKTTEGTSVGGKILLVLSVDLLVFALKTTGLRVPKNTS